MSWRVLLVDSDVDALGELASALRSRGLTVANASGVFEAVEQAFKRRPDVVLAAKEMDNHGALTGAFAVVPELSNMAILMLVAPDASEPPGLNDVVRGDMDHIISRIAEAAPRESRPAAPQEIRGDLRQVPLVDLLQILAMNRRSGVLSITTPSGAGEVRLSAGEVTDALYRRLEGQKAFFRLLGEQEGHFAFSPGEPSGARRIELQTSRLLMEAMRSVDEVRRLRSELSPGGEAFMLTEPATASDPDIESMRKETTSVREIESPPTLRAAEANVSPPPESDSSASSEGKKALADQLTAILQMPHKLDELLDELDASDLSILELLAKFMADGQLRRVSLSDLTTPFASTEQMPVLRSLVTRLTRPGFSLPASLVIAASSKRIPTLGYAVRRISDVAGPNEPPPRAPLPTPLGVLRMGDGVELLLMGLPTDEAFAPIWPLVIHGASAVVRLQDAGGEVLKKHCDALELMLIDAEGLMGSLDISAPAQVAALVRAALEVAAGV